MHQSQTKRHLHLIPRNLRSVPPHCIFISSSHHHPIMSRPLSIPPSPLPSHPIQPSPLSAPQVKKSDQDDAEELDEKLDEDDMKRLVFFEGLFFQFDKKATGFISVEDTAKLLGFLALRTPTQTKREPCARGDLALRVRAHGRLRARLPFKLHFSVYSRTGNALSHPRPIPIVSLSHPIPILSHPRSQSTPRRIATMLSRGQTTTKTASSHGSSSASCVWI